MTVQKEILYKTMLLALFLMPELFGSLEVNISVGLLFFGILLIEKQPKISKIMLNVLLPLLLVLITAFISMWFYHWNWYDILKDFTYLLKPILFISIGYRLVNKIKDKHELFKILIYLGIIFAVIHILKAFYWIFFEYFEVNAVRRFAGKSNFIELLALFLLLANKEQKYFSLKLRYKKFFKLLLIISMILYFSRTLLVGFFLFYIAYKGYTKITPKGLLYFSVLGIVTTGFFSYLNSIELERGAPGMEGLLYKISIAYEEIFISTEDISIKNHAYLWDHWRAYEANQAINQLKETSYGLGLVFGQGLGSLVDLGFVAPLSNIRTQYIPKLHNGFAYVWFKSGLVGLFCYLGFIISLYLKTYSTQEDNIQRFYNNVISGIGIYFMFTSLIITGIYNQGDIISVFLGGIFALKSYYIENRNIRH